MLSLLHLVHHHYHLKSWESRITNLVFVHSAVPAYLSQVLGQTTLKESQPVHACRAAVLNILRMFLVDWYYSNIHGGEMFIKIMISSLFININLNITPILNINTPYYEILYQTLVWKASLTRSNMALHWFWLLPSLKKGTLHYEILFSLLLWKVLLTVTNMALNWFLLKPTLM